MTLIKAILERPYKDLYKVIYPDIVLASFPGY